MIPFRLSSASTFLFDPLSVRGQRLVGDASSAVEEHVLPCHKRRLFTGEEQDRVCYLRDCTETAHWVFVNDVRLLLRCEHLIDHLGLDVTWAERVDADMWCVVHGDGINQHQLKLFCWLRKGACFCQLGCWRVRR